MFARPQGSSGQYQQIGTARLTNPSGAPIAGWFTMPPSSLGAGIWDVKYYALDGAGKTLNSQTATLSINGSGPSSLTSIAPQPIGGPGKAILARDGSSDYLVISEQSLSASSLRIRFRPVGSAEGWQYAYPTTAKYGPGLWSIDVTGWGNSKEYWVEALDGAGSLISRSQGTFVVGGQPSALTAYAEQPETVHFYNQPAATSIKLWYKPSGTSNWIQAPDLANVGTGAWDWDANAITPDKLTNYLYDFRYETRNGAQLVNQAHGQVQLGFNPYVFSNQTDQAPSQLVFDPPQTNAQTLVLSYRLAGSTLANYASVSIPKAASGKFEWNTEALRPTTGSTSFEYFYDLYDSGGNKISPVGGGDHANGYFDVNSDRSTTTRRLEWALVGPASLAAVIDRRQAYNAFGEIISETDGLNHTTNLVYNVMGKLIEKDSPETDVTGDNGVTIRARPIERYYYDLAGRLVGTDDANGNRNTQLLLAGTGEGDGAAAVTIKEFHADQGIKSYGIDVFGDVRKITDEVNAVTQNNYDKAGRLTQVIHPTRVGGISSGVSLTDNYVYDELGQRTGHWNSQLGATVLETTDYDRQNRVSSTKDFAGNVTGYGYNWSSSAITAGLGTFGGWTKTTNITASANTLSEVSDYFGRLIDKNDYGNHNYDYTFNNAGELVAQTNSQGQSINYNYYGNGYIRSITDNALHMVSTFEYDKEGNRTLESYSSTDTGANKIYYQVAAITYDELNRVKTFTDAKATISYKYDANSNRRQVLSYYHDGINGAQQSNESYSWYKYDTMNRFVLTMGQLTGGVIVKGNLGVDVSYDAAGQRKSVTNGSDGSTEDYTYTADGYLEDTKINNVLRARRTSDAMGRVTSYAEYTTDGSTTNFGRTVTYDNVNRVTDEIDTQRQSNATYITTTIHNDYRADAGGEVYTGVDQGVLTHSRRQDQGSSTVINTVYSYQWWDEAKQIGIQIKGDNPANPNSYRWADGASQLSYDFNGHLKAAVVTGGAPRTITYTSDAYGQVLIREERINGALGPRQLYYYLNGNRIGDVGNDGPSRVDYAAALAQRDVAPTTPGAFRNGKAVASADFDQNYEPIGPNYPGQAASDYTVRSGDTLSSIAQAIWGDSSLWYLIADSNGLTAADALVAGQRLIIPNKVTNIHNRSGVYRVYDPGEAIGDALPTLPAEPSPPAAKHGCGVFGQILLIAVAVAVTIIALPAAPATASFGEAALAAALGSVASQGVGLATGIQDKFSFKGVALAALAGGISAGVSTLPGLSGGTGVSGALQAAARGTISSVLTQGIGVATGLQSHFSWSGVAASAVGSSVNSGLYGTLGRTVSGMAGALAGAAATSLVSGRDFGDTLVSQLPSIIGNTIGNIAADRIAAMGAPRSGTNLGGGMIEKDGIVFNQNAINVATNGLSLVDLDTNVDPYRNVMSLDEARAYNARTDVSSIGGGVDGLEMHSSTAKIYIDRAELDRATANFDADEAAHGPYSNSAEIRAGIASNNAILNKADLDILQQAKDFGWEYGKATLGMIAGEGAGLVLGKAIGAGIPLITKFGRATEAALPAVGGKLPNAGGVIRQFNQEGDQVYYRVFSGDSTVGSFLTAVPSRSSAFAREALALPPGNQATFIQEVLVPGGTPLLRSRALPQPAWDRLRGGAEQFELLQHIPTTNFGPGRLLP
jgi:YD repeat-containing protein